MTKKNHTVKKQVPGQKVGVEQFWSRDSTFAKSFYFLLLWLFPGKGIF